MNKLLIKLICVSMLLSTALRASEDIEQIEQKPTHYRALKVAVVAASLFAVSVLVDYTISSRPKVTSNGAPIYPFNYYSNATTQRRSLGTFGHGHHSDTSYTNHPTTSATAAQWKTRHPIRTNAPTTTPIPTAPWQTNIDELFNPKTYVGQDGQRHYVPQYQYPGQTYKDAYGITHEVGQPAQRGNHR